jgi:thiamine transport system substrate-binding protein
MTFGTTRAAVLIGIAVVAAACGGSGSNGESAAGVTVRLVTHDSFLVSDGLFDRFTAATGIRVEVLSAGDAGEVVARAILTSGQPEGDVLYGIDNTFLQRGLDADLFDPYRSPALDDVPDDLELDPEHRVSPIDVGDVCVNYWTDALPGPVPTSLDDLTEPANAASFVTENPETSSPGFAFLLATIARYGEGGWEDYWRQLVDGGVTITSGWEEAYSGEFVAGGGSKSIVTSYATSPVAEVVFSATPIDTPPTGVLTDSCFRQIEFAGVLRGTDHPDEARALIDFMLGPVFQADIPLNMFVVPARTGVELPAVFVDNAAVVADPLVLSPAEIEANRADWTQRWTEIVQR